MGARLRFGGGDLPPQRKTEPDDDDANDDADVFRDARSNYFDVDEDYSVHRPTTDMNTLSSSEYNTQYGTFADAAG